MILEQLKSKVCGMQIIYRHVGGKGISRVGMFIQGKFPIKHEQSIRLTPHPKGVVSESFKRYSDQSPKKMPASA